MEIKKYFMFNPRDFQDTWQLYIIIDYELFR